MSPQYAKIENVGDVEWNDGQPGHPYTIPPREEIIVAWAQLALGLGAPEMRDSPRDPARQQERQRLHLRYGVTSGVEGDVRPGWAEAMPKLVAKTLAGEQLATVADDPDGQLLPSAAPVLSDEDTATRIAELEAAITQLKGERSGTINASPAQREQAEKSPDALVPATDSMPPPDAPAPRTAARSAK